MPKTRKPRVRRVKRRVGREVQIQKLKRRMSKNIDRIMPSLPTMPKISMPKISLPKISMPKKRLIFRKGKPPKRQKMKLPKTAKVVPKKGAAKRLPKEIVKELIVADVMSKKSIVVHVNDPLSYVVRLFADKKISGAPVVRGSNFVGVMSESDIVRLVGVKDLLSVDSSGLKKLSGFKVSEIMHKRPVFVYEYTKLSDATHLMNKHDITRLPVLNDKRQIAGVVSRSDIVKTASKELLMRMLKKRRIERVATKIETDIDNVLKIVEKKGSIDIGMVKKELMLPEDKIEEWAKILEKHGLLELHYPTFGKPKLRKKLDGEEPRWQRRRRY